MQLALIGNLSMMETLVVAVIAILVFGKRLPEVAVRAVRWMQGLRRSLDDLRRETGLDAELRSVERSIQDVAREARVDDPMRQPAEPRAERRKPTGRPQVQAESDSPVGPQPGPQPAAQPGPPASTLSDVSPTTPNPPVGEADGNDAKQAPRS